MADLPHHEITANMTLAGLVERLVMDGLKLVPEMALLSRGLAIDDETVLVARRAPDDAFAFHVRHPNPLNLVVIDGDKEAQQFQVLCRLQL